MSWQSLQRVASLQHERAFYAPTGVRATQQDIRLLRDRIRDVMENAISRGTLQGNRYFDVMAARVIRSEMDMTMSEAASVGVWSFMGCVVFPDVVRWRFPGQLGEPTPSHRMLGSGRGVRNALGRLWWRAELLRDEAAADPYHLLEDLSEDELVQITERPSIAGNRRLAKHIGRAIAGLEIGPKRQAVSRDTSKRIRRRLAFVDLRALPEADVEAFVRECLDEAIAVADSVGVPRSPARAGESEEGYGSEATLVRKALSANDLGATGSHQSAIVIPAADAHKLAPLDENTENPSADLVVRHGATDEASVWRLIHYNGRQLGHSTRDEYRLSGTTAFLRHFRAGPGDYLVISRDGQGALSGWIERDR